MKCVVVHVYTFDLNAAVARLQCVFLNAHTSLNAIRKARLPIRVDWTIETKFSSNNGITSLGVATNGQLVIGSTGADPVIASLTAGSGISITPGAGSLTIAATGTFAQDYTQSFLLGGM